MADLSGILDATPASTDRSSFGDELLLRYRYRDGAVQAALPLRVVEDSPARIVAWLAEGTDIMYWALVDGTDPRSVPLEERFASGLTTAPRTWTGGGVLRVIPAGRPFQVLHFWDGSGAFAGWYVNFETPAVRSGNRLDTVDWHLDLWIDRDRQAQWKDEDEAGAALLTGHLTAEDLMVARETGEAIIGDFEDFLRAIGDWRSFRPPGQWVSPQLPSDWASQPSSPRSVNPTHRSAGGQGSSPEGSTTGDGGPASQEPLRGVLRS
ncbi:MAG: DUF402 domain-containing protein [Candidatus Nanopelagicales bacterium]